MCEVSEHCEYTLETCPFCNQIDLEDQIAEEESKPQFKDGNKVIKLANNGGNVSNDNLTESLMYFLIDANICSESDFVQN